MAQLLRLSLFQVSVGMVTVLLLGTLNRVMIVELGLGAMLVAAMIALPVLVAPFRAFLGHRSDTHRSSIGWRRVPYLWFGTLWMMGGLALMPFSLLVLGGDTVHDVPFAGTGLAGAAFIMTGLGLHMTQTAGLALASDRADDETRPRVVALLYVMFLLGMGVSAVVIGWLLSDFTPLALIRVVQGSALLVVALNLVALWKQEHVRPQTKAERSAPRPRFADAWQNLTSGGDAGRLLAVVFIGTLAFNMQDVLLEPYGGEIMGLSVGRTTWLSAMWAAGALSGFALAGRALARGRDAFRMAATGLLAGVVAFSAVVFAAPMQAAWLFYAGAVGIGFGSGLFAVATLTAAMGLGARGIADHGLALGAWGAAQATAAGLAIALGGAVRDGVAMLASKGALGEALNTPAIGYTTVYHIEIALCFATLIILGPLVRLSFIQPTQTPERGKIGLADFPT
ncbi:PucC family protein [Palleronia sp. THAF1]|uniref:PucC family protein n=1 Tax=Palleronia sp. THAF1 TaxID=2587842 RepID=UPI000F5351AF|nr:PucC family protein [Palleronia sp. THAF1]